MSHYTSLKPKFLVANEGDLLSSLRAMFGEKAVEVHEEASKIGGYDSQAGKKAHIIVRKEFVAKVNDRKHAYNDIGYERGKDGLYSLHVDPVDYPQKLQDKVAQDYAERVATRKLKSQGYTLKREVMKDGVVKLVASKYS